MSFDGLKARDIAGSQSIRGYQVPRLVTMDQQLPVKETVLQYCPRKIFAHYHTRKQRFALTVAHRRAGKTVAEVVEGICRLGEVQSRMARGYYPGRTVPPQVAFVSPTFKQAKRDAWPYAKRYASVIPGVRVMEGDLTLHFPGGGAYLFAGSDNHESLRGPYLDHVSLDEFGSQDPRVWGEIIRPELSDYGGTATFIGSAKGQNHFYKLMKKHEKDPDWLITILKASQTGILPEAELKDARATMTEEQYRQEYECDFNAAVTGTFYGREISAAEDEKRIGRVLHDRASDTHAGWDLGKGAGMAIWVFQRTPGGEWHFLEYYEGADPDHALEHAVSWIKARPYRIDEHFLPHDANATELQSPNTTRKDFLENRGLSVTVLPRAGIEEGINTVKIHFNRFFFDAERCEHGIEALRMYRSEYDMRKDSYSTKPVHDWASHAADAMRYAVMAMPENGRNASWNQPIRRNLRVVV